MQETIQSFMDYLQTEKKASKNTEGFPTSATFKSWYFFF